ncbi:MAG: response regulator [Microcystaceae cyanobacterium]
MLNPDIRDQAYQFFIEEAPELLQIIESGLLTLKEERNKQTVHEIMRAAHSIKGGAASVELDQIKTLAHRLEDIFKALYDDSVEIDTELETLLLQGYDCLRNPLEEQMTTGGYDGEAAIAYAEPVWQKIEAHLGDSLANAEQYIPSSADLGVDIVSSLFEVDVTQGIEQLAKVAEHPNDYDIMAELQTQMEVFGGFAEMLGLPGFGEITEATLKAVELNPDKAHYILQLSLVDLIGAREQVLEKGDRTSGGSPSTALLGFTTKEEKTVENDNNTASDWDDANILSFDSLFEPTPVDDVTEESGWTEIDTLTSPHLAASFNASPPVEAPSEVTEEFPALDDVFGEPIDFDTTDNQVSETPTDHPDLDDIFGSDIPPLEDVFNIESETEEIAEAAANNINIAPPSPELEEVFNIGLETEEIAEEQQNELNIVPPSPELEEVFNIGLETEEIAEEQQNELNIAPPSPELEEVFNIDLETEEISEEQANELNIIPPSPELEEVFNIDLKTEEISEEKANELNIVPSSPDLEEVFNIDLKTEEISEEQQNELNIIPSSPDLEEVFGASHTENLPLEEVLTPDNREETPEESSHPNLENVFGVISDDVDDQLFDIKNENTLPSETADPSLDEIFGVNGSVVDQDNEVTESLKNRLIDTEAKTMEDVLAADDLGDNQDLFTIPADPQETDLSDLSEDDIHKSSESSQFIDPGIPTLEDLFEVAGFEDDDNIFTIPEETEEVNTSPTAKNGANDSTDHDLSQLIDSEVPSLEDIFKAVRPKENDQSFPIPEKTTSETPQESENIVSDTPSLDEVFGSVMEVENIFDSLPTVKDTELSPSVKPQSQKQKKNQSKPKVSPPSPPSSRSKNSSQSKEKVKPKAVNTPSNLSIKVDFERLERMNNLVGELMINRNSLSLQNDQMQGSVKSLLNRFATFQTMIGKLQELSDQMLIAPEKLDSKRVNPTQLPDISRGLTNFDSLEMDTYNTLYSLLGILLEEMIQLEESVDDVVLFARTSNRTLEQQRQMLTNLRDELMWARMLPLGEVLNRFPRLLRDLSANYGKTVRLKLTGTGVLVDKAALEKLYDPLLHLVRNGFDHGIESPEDRKKMGKPEEGQIEIRAYHQGNQTIVEVCDDGKGLDYEKIKEKAIKTKIITEQQAAVMPKERIQNLIFEPAFSTAAQVSELSGRGVGLDVVRSQLQALKGTVNVTSKEGRGTIFTLKLPLTLTIAKLLVCQVTYENNNSRVSVAFPSDTIEEILVPEEKQLKASGNKRFLLWQNQIIPIYPVKDLLQYNCPLPESFADKGLKVTAPDEWGLPLLLLRRGQQLYAVEVSRLETEQELVIKPFGNAISAPNYTYGCTILGDGQLVPVVNGANLIEQFVDPDYGTTLSPTTTADSEGLSTPSVDNFEPQVMMTQAPLMLVVDDSAALRRTLALTLEKAGYRVVQARDGREALDQLQHTSGINMVICDVEMPNMNGFEFLGQRRRNPDMMKVPVAMLTSRSNDKHRQLAMTLGASAYFTKPYIEQQFLTSVANILKEKPAVTVTS